MVKEGKTIKHEPQVTEIKLWNLKNLPLAVLSGFIFAVIDLIVLFLFDLDLVSSLIVTMFFIIIYAIILFFLLEPSMLRQVNQREVEYLTVEKPIELIRTIERPVEVIKTIDRPYEVIKEIEIPTPVYIDKPPVYVDRPTTVYVDRPKKKLNIKKFEFVASNQTKTYHKSNCRLAKLIKRKYKISSDDEASLKKKGFTPCEVCVMKRVKV